MFKQQGPRLPGEIGMAISLAMSLGLIILAVVGTWLRKSLLGLLG